MEDEVKGLFLAYYFKAIYNVYISMMNKWRAYFQKGLDPFPIKFELLISRHYLS